MQARKKCEVLLRVLLEVRVVGVLDEPLLKDAGLLTSEVRLLDSFLVDLSFRALRVLDRLRAVAVSLGVTLRIERLLVGLRP